MEKIKSALKTWSLKVGSVDRRSLILFRFLLGLVAFWDLFIRLSSAEAFYSDQGVLPRSLLFLQDWIGTQAHYSLQSLSGSTIFQQGFLGVGALTALLLSAGVFWRWSAVVAWMVVTSAQFRNPYLHEGADAYLRMLLFWTIFLPEHPRWFASQNSGSKRISSWGLFSILFQIFIVYFVTGLGKLGGDGWWKGEAISDTLRYTWISRDPDTWLLNYPIFLRGLSYLILLGELLLPVLLLLPSIQGISRLCFLALFVPVHLGIWFFMDVGLFSPVSLVALVLLIPSSVWEARQVPSFKQKVIKDSRFKRTVQLVSWAFIICFLLPALRPPDRGLFKIPYALHLQQSWNMFASGEMFPDSDRLLPVGTLENGIVVNLFTNRPFDEAEFGESFLSCFPNHKWKKLFKRIQSSDNGWLAKRYLQYACEQNPSLRQVYFARYSAEKKRTWMTPEISCRPE